MEPPWLKGSSAQNPALLKQGLDQFLQQEVEAPTGMWTNVFLSSRSLFVYVKAFFDMYAYSPFLTCMRILSTTSCLRFLLIYFYMI